jgi:hypothetical protein
MGLGVSVWNKYVGLVKFSTMRTLDLIGGPGTADAAAKAFGRPAPATLVDFAREGQAAADARRAAAGGGFNPTPVILLAGFLGAVWHLRRGK